MICSIAVFISLAQTSSNRPSVVPSPTVARLDWSKPVSFDSLRFDQFDAVAQAEFKRRHPGFSLKGGRPMRVQISFGRQGSRSDGFRLITTSSGAKLEVFSNGKASDQRSARFAISYLARLTRARGNSLELPTGVLEVSPKVAWRGVHLFVGPNALAFHQRLWTHVLLPLGFNKVVLQCERTEWLALPNLRGGICMKRGDLAKLCDWYRSIGVEPIPLVQSFGHMDWLFTGKKNLDLAMDPKTPYALDPRKPRVGKLMDQLWREVIQVTKAKTVHFGLDEIALRGFPKSPGLATKLWRQHLPTLAGIAKRHKVRMMLWGDECLAPGQAPNATNAPNVNEASLRRSMIPKGSLVADWHYGRLNPVDDYLPALRLLKREGFAPISSTWHRPENVRNFTLAAIKEKAGTLQTTWAGYELNERVMMKNLNQFSAMVLASDYAWSGKTGDITYDPARVLLALYGK